MSPPISRLQLLGTRLRLLAKVRRSNILFGDVQYNADGVATVHDARFLVDPAFTEAYAAGLATGSWGEPGSGRVDLRWRAQVILWAVDATRSLPGALVECGVNRGGFTAAIHARFPDFRAEPRVHYLFDTFAGLDASLLGPEERALSTHYSYTDVYEEVRQRFGNTPGIRIVKGSIPDTLTEYQGEPVSFLSIDMNCTPPEQAALEFFWPKLLPGAIVVLDDHAHPMHRGQGEMHRAFAKSVERSILVLPTGQGLLIK